MTFAPNTPFGVVATRYTPSRYCVLVVVPSASPNGPSSHVFHPGCCDGSTERKYSSGNRRLPYQQARDTTGCCHCAGSRRSGTTSSEPTLTQRTDCPIRRDLASA